MVKPDIGVITNVAAAHIENFKNKKLTILTFIEGKSKKILDPTDCKLIGIETAKLHKLTASLSINRK